MNLKDLPQSYWLASTPKTDYPTLDEDIDVDIVIVGGGLAGISCAYLLQKRDIKLQFLNPIEFAKVLQPILQPKLLLSMD